MRVHDPQQHQAHGGDAGQHAEVRNGLLEPVRRNHAWREHEECEDHPEGPDHHQEREGHQILKEQIQAE